MSSDAQERYRELAARLRAAWEVGETIPDFPALVGGEPLSADELVELCLTDQSFRWRTPQPLRVEDYLAMFPAIAPQRELVLDLAYGEFRARQQVGKPYTAEEIESRFPDLAAQLREQLELGGWLDETVTAPAPAPPTARICALPQSGRVGAYELGETIAQGGMGVVFRARDVRLNRIVALKMIRPDRITNDVDHRRFHNETLTIAQLDHPHIVPIYDVGEAEGLHYFTMKLMEGGDLQQHRRRYLDDPCAAARVLADVAEAVHHAHQRGVLHRDVKPSNVLLDGAGRAYVTDFGLAARLEARPNLTASGDLLGTPAYLAPEQLTPDREPLTVAADVYGAGAVLYVLLTGQPPFGDEHLIPMLESIRQREPPPPSRLNPRVPADLEQVCLKALAKRPADRYASAKELADDLQRFLAGKPVHARPVTWWQRRWRWVRGHPDLTAIAGTILMAATVLLTLLGLQTVRLQATRESLDGALEQATAQQAKADEYRRQAEVTQRESTRLRQSAQQLENQAKAARAGALAQQELARETAYCAAIQRGELAWRAGDTVEFSRLMDEQVPAPGEPDVRGFEWFVLDRLYRPKPTRWSLPSGSVRCVRYSSDGRLLAVAGDAPLLRILEAENGRYAAAWDSPTTVRGLAFSPDGSWLATAGDDGQVRLYPAAGGPPQAWRIADAAVLNVAFVGDGSRLVTCDGDGQVRLLSASTGEIVATMTDGQKAIECIAVAPDGQWFVSGHADGRLKIWDLATQQAVYEFSTGETKQVKCLAISADGRLVATGGVDRRVRVAALRRPWSHQWLWTGRHFERLYAVAFSADVRRVAGCDKNGSVRVWRLDREESNDEQSDRSAEFNWQAHQGRAYDLAFDPRHDALATGGTEAHVARWTLRSQDEGLALGESARKEHPDRSLAFTPDSEMLAVAAQDGVQLWNLRTRQREHRLSRDGQPRNHVAISRDGQYLAAGLNSRRLVEVWRKSPEGFRFAWETTEQASDQLSFAASTDLLAVASWEAGEVAICDPASGRLERRIRAEQCCGGEFSPDGRLLAFTELDDAVVWDWTAGRPSRRLREHWNTVRCVSFSPTGRRLVSCGGDRRIAVWDAASGQRLHTMMGHRGQVVQAVFAGEDRLVSLDEDGEVLVWNANLGMLLCSLRKPQPNWCFHLAVSPDQHWLACHLADGFIQLFEVRGAGDLRSAVSARSGDLL